MARNILAMPSHTAASKGQMLPENGYIVLRFLVEDLTKELDTVLDTILRSLVRRRDKDRLHPD
ncbi:MAG: DUF559 domain-containing protein [Acidobacteria bacterium]|nr:DUF559 domain-containing protein [Acidobacteriota bacterium]